MLRAHEIQDLIYEHQGRVEDLTSKIGCLNDRIRWNVNAMKEARKLLQKVRNLITIDIPETDLQAVINLSSRAWATLNSELQGEEDEESEE